MRSVQMDSNDDTSTGSELCVCAVGIFVLQNGAVCVFSRLL